MRISDLLLLCVSNLKRRKLRTLLTVLGVLIGTSSVVIMLSLGIGLTKATEELYATFGSLTSVEVYSNSYYGSSDEQEPRHLTDDVVHTFSQLDHVKTVAPRLSCNVVIRQGLYECSTPLRGVTQEYMEQMNLASGKTPDSGDLGLVMGNMMPMSFSNVKTNESYWASGKLPDVDYEKPLFVIFDTDALIKSQDKTAETPTPAPKKYMLNVSGTIAGAVDEYNEFAFDVYTDIDALKTQLKKIFGKNPIPGQPTNKKGKPLGTFVYDHIIVYCDDMDHVTEVQKTINDMGYQANSNMEWLQQSQQQSQMIQMVLGGIGAISLLVAAIGIANTMMMSIYERTREIGIMKVLGCDMREIRNMFLIESGYIGLMGGVCGVILSYIISAILNKIGIASQMFGMSGQTTAMSTIPVWLAGCAIVFAIFISMFAGFVPSMKAMRLSPLTAIHNE